MEMLESTPEMLLWLCCPLPLQANSSGKASRPLCFPAPALLSICRYHGPPYVGRRFLLSREQHTPGIETYLLQQAGGQSPG